MEVTIVSDGFWEIEMGGGATKVEDGGVVGTGGGDGGGVGTKPDT